MIDLVSIFESIEDVAEFPPIDEVVVGTKENEETPRLVSQNSTSSYSGLPKSRRLTEFEISPNNRSF